MQILIRALVFALCLLVVIDGTSGDGRLSWSQIAQRAASSPGSFGIPSKRQYEAPFHRYNSSLNSRQSSARFGGCRDDYNFDFILLALQWAPGFCRTSPEHCVKMENRHFTIHGFWPQYFSAESPNFCCFDNKFDRNALRPIMADLEEYWPSLTSADNFRFWSHEWLKHGTCAKNAPRMAGEFDYFKSALDRVKNMAILSTLKQAGIVPSKTRAYKAVDIQNNLRQIHGASRVAIECDLDHGQPTPVLTGINFCFDRSLKPIDCRPSKNRCTRDIYFPQQ